jgi:type VI secretion system protein ImpK
MGEPDHTAVVIKGVLSECFNDMRLARATDLARTRRYLEAKTLLTPAGRPPTDPRELDLLARIAANQRRFLEAEQLWNEASKISPGNEAYRLAARHAAKARFSWLQLKQAAFAVVIALALAAIILAAINFLSGGSRKPAAPTTGPTQPASSVQSKP